MRKVLLVLCLIVGAALPAAAQGRPDPAALDSARALIEETGITRTMDALLVQMSVQMSQSLQAVNPGQGKAIAELIQDYLVPELRKSLPELLEMMTTLYAQHFTAVEMDELRAFYRTPTGQKFIANLTPLTLEGQRLGNLWGQRTALRLFEEMRPALEQRGLRMPRI